MPQPVIHTPEEVLAPFNQPLSGFAAAVEDARRLRTAQDRLAAASARLEKAALEAWDERKKTEAGRAELRALVQQRREQGKRVR